MRLPSGEEVHGGSLDCDDFEATVMAWWQDIGRPGAEHPDVPDYKRDWASLLAEHEDAGCARAECKKP